MNDWRLVVFYSTVWSSVKVMKQLQVMKQLKVMKHNGGFSPHSPRYHKCNNEHHKLFSFVCFSHAHVSVVLGGNPKQNSHRVMTSLTRCWDQEIVFYNSNPLFIYTNISTCHQKKQKQKKTNPKTLGISCLSGLHLFQVDPVSVKTHHLPQLNLSTRTAARLPPPLPPLSPPAK